MTDKLDNTDRRILRELQNDASLSMDALSDRVNLSRNACWRRVKQMEDAGVIKARVALVEPETVGLGLSTFIMVRTNEHEPDWLERFQRTVKSMPEILGAHRMSGDLDYILRVQVADIRDYDRFYQRLIKQIPISDISASFVMDDIKNTTALPV